MPRRHWDVRLSRRRLPPHGHDARRDAGSEHIPLSHLYAALAYYYANQDACDQFMRERDEEAERLYQEHVASRKSKRVGLESSAVARRERDAQGLAASA